MNWKNLFKKKGAPEQESEDEQPELEQGSLVMSINPDGGVKKNVAPFIAGLAVVIVGAIGLLFVILSPGSIGTKTEESAKPSDTQKKPVDLARLVDIPSRSLAEAPKAPVVLPKGDPVDINIEAGSLVGKKNGTPNLVAGHPGLATHAVAGMNNGGTPGTVTDPYAQQQQQVYQQMLQRRAQAQQQAYSAPAMQQGKRDGGTSANADPSASPQSSKQSAYDKLLALQQAGAQAQQGGENANQAQDAKEAFLKKAKEDSTSAYLNSMKQAPLSKYELKAGSFIPATLVTGLNSDLPGQVIGLVHEDVYDSASGQSLLVPRGTKLFGKYDSKVSFGQERALVVWNRLIFPDGSSFDIKGMQGYDTQGYAGYSDQVDHHYGKLIGGAVLTAVFGAGVAMTQPASSTTTATNASPSFSQAMGESLGQSMGQVGTQFAQKQMQVQPTIVIRPGYKFNIAVSQDMVFPGAWK